VRAKQQSGLPVLAKRIVLGTGCHRTYNCGGGSNPKYHTLQQQLVNWGNCFSPNKTLAAISFLCKKIAPLKAHRLRTITLMLCLFELLSLLSL